MVTPYITGTAAVPNGRFDAAELELATRVVREAVSDAGLSLGDVDGVFMPKPRPWTAQGFFSTVLARRLGLDLRRSLEVYTGGTSGGKAFQAAVADVRSGRLGTAVVLGAERNSTVETDAYLEYILDSFDQEFQAPMGPTIPGVYAQSLQRYLHEHDIDREAIAEVVVKNRENGVATDEALFSTATTVEAVLDSRPIADPLRLYECPAPCDGAAAVVVTGSGSAEQADASPVEVAGIGAHHPPSHFTGVQGSSLSTFPAASAAFDEALDDAAVDPVGIDVFEPYAPFPHVEAILTEELGIFERGDGADACARGETAVGGTFPVSPSGGCIGRGHPAMVTPVLNYVAAVRQLRGTAANQVPGAKTALTTTEHGHVDGVTATVFRRGA